MRPPSGMEVQSYGPDKYRETERERETETEIQTETTATTATKETDMTALKETQPSEKDNTHEYETPGVVFFPFSSVYLTK